MAMHIVETGAGRANDFDTVEELGSHIQKLAALLRAAMQTGASGRQDEGWLLSIALDEAEAAESRYMQWALPENGEAK